MPRNLGTIEDTTKPELQNKKVMRSSPFFNYDFCSAFDLFKQF